MYLVPASFGRVNRSTSISRLAENQSLLFIVFQSVFPNWDFTLLCDNNRQSYHFEFSLEFIVLRFSENINYINYGQMQFELFFEIEKKGL